MILIVVHHAALATCIPRDKQTTGTVSPDLALKPVARVSQFGPQNQQLQFGDLCLKITATIFWFGPQNQEGYSLSVVPQN
jgi:hypothetical protein